MMADAVKYVVMCNCDDEPGALIIAWIDDERPAGGHIQMRSNTRFTETQWGRHIGGNSNAGHAESMRRYPR